MSLILAWLSWFFSDPQAVSMEYPRAAAAVLVASASLEVDDAPSPAPQPEEECCKDCKGTGKIKHPDGHQTDCPCPGTCRCKAGGR